MKAKRYSPRTVIAAQRRTLRMGVRVLGQLSGPQLTTLRADGTGVLTLQEVIDHMAQASELKVNWARLPEGQEER